MAARADFERVNALITEAVALCEAAQDEFERINKDIHRSISEGRALIASVESQEEQARSRLFAARALLSERLRKRRRLVQRRAHDE